MNSIARVLSQSRSQPASFRCRVQRRRTVPETTATSHAGGHTKREAVSLCNGTAVRDVDVAADLIADELLAAM